MNKFVKVLRNQTIFINIIQHTKVGGLKIFPLLADI